VIIFLSDGRDESNADKHQVMEKKLLPVLNTKQFKLYTIFFGGGNDCKTLQKMAQLAGEGKGRFCRAIDQVSLHECFTKTIAKDIKFALVTAEEHFEKMAEKEKVDRGKGKGKRRN